MQALYHNHIVTSDRASLPTRNSTERLSLPGDDGVELEWEHQYDVGAKAAAEAEGTAAAYNTPTRNHPANVELG